MKFHAIWMSDLTPAVELKYSCKVAIVFTSILLSWVLYYSTLYLKILAFSWSGVPLGDEGSLCRVCECKVVYNNDQLKWAQPLKLTSTGKWVLLCFRFVETKL